MAVKVKAESSKLATSAVEVAANEAGPGDVGGKRGGTVQDQQDMWRIGREQELNVSWLAKWNWIASDHAHSEISDSSRFLDLLLY
jgi:hypothetical protein